MWLSQSCTHKLPGVTCHAVIYQLCPHEPVIFAGSHQPSRQFPLRLHRLLRWWSYPRFGRPGGLGDGHSHRQVGPLHRLCWLQPQEDTEGLDTGGRWMDVASDFLPYSSLSLSLSFLACLFFGGVGLAGCGLASGVNEAFSQQRGVWRRGPGQTFDAALAR